MCGWLHSHSLHSCLHQVYEAAYSLLSLPVPVLCLRQWMSEWMNEWMKHWWAMQAYSAGIYYALSMHLHQLTKSRLGLGIFLSVLLKKGQLQSLEHSCSQSTAEQPWDQLCTSPLGVCKLGKCIPFQKWFWSFRKNGNKTFYLFIYLPIYFHFCYYFNDY